MSNGIEIIDKIDKVPLFIVIIFAIIAVILWCVAAIGLYKDDIIGYVALFFAIVCTICAVSARCSKDKYRVIISEDTKMEQFYNDWEVEEKEGEIFTVIPISKNALTLVNEYGNERERERKDMY